jgi:asparagine synthetase B (glutamine-hydrolysing)
MGRPAAGPAGTWLATLRKGGTERFEVSSGPGSSHSVTSDGNVTVLFDGLLHTRRDWLHDFSLSKASDASLVLHAYLRWGEGVLERVKGLFALIVWDGGKDLLLCARDPHGMHPCFYADDAGDLFLSASAEALTRHPQIPGTVDRVAIADHLCHRWPRLESTYFEAVRRLPGGYALRVHEGKRTVRRYWDPIPPGRPIDYISDEEAGRFTELLDQAVNRCLPGGPAAIYLSGGLDSVTIAALAQEQLRDRDTGPLLALSLVFEHPDANEEGTQRAVATRLGLAQKVVTVGDAVGPNGLLADALEMSASRSAPMMNLWNPAYAFLARYAAEHGCEVILTGNGGDEWLEAGLHNARRALERLDFAAVYRLWACMQRSYPYSRGTVARNLLWTYGLRPILRQGAASTLERTAPGVLARQEQRRFAQTTPPWIPPDPGLRDQMLERYRAHKRAPRRGALDNPMVAYELEEFYESGRHLGIPLLHPFWDADLTAFLARVRSRLLMRDGYSKGLVRQSLAQKFPQLGFDRSRKVTASGFYRSVMIREGVEAWKRMGGAQALAELGIVDGLALDRHMNDLFRQGDAGLSGADPGKTWQIWYVLTTEAWLRPRLGRPAP